LETPQKLSLKAKIYLSNYRDKITYPKDVAYEKNGKREEMPLEKLPLNAIIFDIGEGTVKQYKDIMSKANIIFVNGPVGVYEEEISGRSTKALWKAVEDASGFTVIGGGDTVTSFTKFTDIKNIDYVSTAGGALIRYLSGVELPLLKAMSKCIY
jgi:phosphoglycerate kinase